jgi:hypothetical protein
MTSARLERRRCTPARWAMFLDGSRSPHAQSNAAPEPIDHPMSLFQLPDALAVSHSEEATAGIGNKSGKARES